MAKYLALVSNRPTEVEGTATSAGAGDANKIPQLGADGRLDTSLLPTGIGADVAVIEASENLAAGDFVNIHDSTGAKVRKADASAASAGKIAHGFVLAGVTSGQSATVYFEGRNDALSGLTPGLTYALSHSAPGGVVALASGSTTAGHALQIVGIATAADTINTEFGQPVIRA